MPDLLSHVFLAYASTTLLAWRYGWLDRATVTAVLVGAILPDATKVRLLVTSWQVSEWLSIPFSWSGLHTLGGTLVAVLVGGLLVRPRDRRRTLLALGFGAATHLFADALFRRPDGHSYSVLWPLTRYQPPTPGLYLSTELWPVAVTGALALGAYLLTRRHRAAN